MNRLADSSDEDGDDAMMDEGSSEDDEDGASGIIKK